MNAGDGLRRHLCSNAALQWLGNHETLFPRLLSFVRPGGVLAVQVPRNADELCDRITREAIGDSRWAAKLKGVRDFWNVRPPETYYDLLAPRARAIDLWETRYFHALEGVDAVFRWSMGTGLRPFASALDGPLRQEFLEHCRRLLARRLSHTSEREDHPPISASVPRRDCPINRRSNCDNYSPVISVL